MRLPGVEIERPEPGFKSAPVFILLCGIETGRSLSLMVYQRWRHEVFISNLASAFLCMQLAAKSLGLGSQWFLPRQPDGRGSEKVSRYPEKLKIYDMMAVGYPAYQLDPGLQEYRRDDSL